MTHLLKVLTQIKDKLRLSCAFAALPIGLEDKLSGLVDVVHMRAIYFEGTPFFSKRIPLLSHAPATGETGSNVRYADIPADMAEAAKTARRALVEAVGEVDDEMVPNRSFLVANPLCFNCRATSSCLRATRRTRSSKPQLGTPTLCFAHCKYVTLITGAPPSKPHLCRCSWVARE